MCVYASVSCGSASSTRGYADDRCVYADDRCAYADDLCVYADDRCVYADDLCAYADDLCVYAVDLCGYPCATAVFPGGSAVCDRFARGQVVPAGGAGWETGLGWDVTVRVERDGGAAPGAVDVLIVTALQDELEAVLALGEGGRAGWQELRDLGGFRYYRRDLPERARRRARGRGGVDRRDGRARRRRSGGSSSSRELDPGVPGDVRHLRRVPRRRWRSAT